MAMTLDHVILHPCAACLLLSLVDCRLLISPSAITHCTATEQWGQQSFCYHAASICLWCCPLVLLSPLFNCCLLEMLLHGNKSCNAKVAAPTMTMWLPLICIIVLLALVTASWLLPSRLWICTDVIIHSVAAVATWCCCLSVLMMPLLLQLAYCLCQWNISF